MFPCLLLGGNVLAQDRAIPIQSLLGQPFEVYDQVLGRPSKSGMNSMNKPMREYKPAHPLITTVYAEVWHDDLVPAQTKVTFRKGTIRTWQEGLKTLGIAVPASAHPSKGGREAAGGDIIVGIPGLGATVTWAPSPSGSRFSFVLSRGTLDAGNKRYIRMRQEGLIKPSEPVAPVNAPGKSLAVAPSATPLLLSRQDASRTILPGSSPYVVGKGFVDAKSSWILGGQSLGFLVWHLWPNPKSGHDFDVFLKLKTAGGIQLRSSLFVLDISAEGAARLVEPNLAEIASVKELLGQPMTLQVSRRGREIFALSNGSAVLRGKVPQASVGFFPSEMSLEASPGSPTEVQEIRWRTPGYKAELETKAARTYPAFGKLRDRMSVSQVSRIMGTRALYDEAATWPTGRWLVMRFPVKGLGYLRAAFLNDQIYGGGFIFDRELGADEMVRALGLRVSRWEPMSMALDRGWESSFQRKGRTADGATVTITGVGRHLMFEWRDESKLSGRS